MFIAHKSNKIISIHEIEWECRRIAKGLATRKYWPWLATVTSVDSDGKETFDFSDEDYEIILVNDDLFLKCRKTRNMQRRGRIRKF